MNTSPRRSAPGRDRWRQRHACSTARARRAPRAPARPAPPARPCDTTSVTSALAISASSSSRFVRAEIVAAAAAVERRQPLLAQEVQVDGVEHDARLGREPAHRVDVLRGDVMTRQHDDVELAAALHQQVGDRAHVRMEQHLDATLLQRAHVRLPMLEVVGDERDLASQRRGDLEQRLHPQRAGILVRRQHARVDRPASAGCAQRSRSNSARTPFG